MRNSDAQGGVQAQAQAQAQGGAQVQAQAQAQGGAQVQAQAQAQGGTQVQGGVQAQAQGGAQVQAQPQTNLEDLNFIQPIQWFFTDLQTEEDKYKRVKYVLTKVARQDLFHEGQTTGASGASGASRASGPNNQMGELLLTVIEKGLLLIFHR